MITVVPGWSDWFSNLEQNNILRLQLYSYNLRSQVPTEFL